MVDRSPRVSVSGPQVQDRRHRIERQFALRRGQTGAANLGHMAAIEAMFAAPDFTRKDTGAFDATYATDPVFRAWTDTNPTAHRAPGYAIVTVSLKAHGQTPGDASADQMRVLADLAERSGHDELRISQDQSVILPHVHKSDLPELHKALKQAGPGTANAGLISDINACPGMDYCALATARSIPVAQQIATRFEELRIEHEVGPLKIRIPGCINACGHHHVGHIGILGLDRGGVETYQITLGGDGGPDTVIGERTGPGFSATEIVAAVERLIRAYLALRESGEEPFIDTCCRLGLAPFKSALYGKARAHAA